MPKVKVLAISGSPRRGGYTDNLLDGAIRGAISAGAVAEKIILNELDFKACQECGGCDRTGVCVINDDMKIIYEKLNDADVVIIGAPIFFGSIPAQLKAMIDRVHCLWVLKYVLKRKPTRTKYPKKGIFLCNAGKDAEAYFKNAGEIIRIFFTTLDIEYFGGLFLGGINTLKKNSVKAKGALKEAFKLGEAVVKSERSV